MTHSTQQRTFRRASAGVLMVALLAACGGGEILAILQIVTPLAGAWVQQDGSGDLVFFDQAEAEDKLFSAKVPVTVTVSNLPQGCGNDATLNGTLDNGRLTLFPTSPASTTACMEGSFTDLRRLELVATGAPAKQVYLNDRVAVNLQVGVWSAANGVPTLKFTDTPAAPGVASISNGLTAAVAGCDVTNSAAKVAFTGTITGFDTTTLARPKIAQLRSDPSNALLFSQVEFVDGATLKLVSASNQSLTLTRKPDPANTTCP